LAGGGYDELISSIEGVGGGAFHPILNIPNTQTSVTDEVCARQVTKWLRSSLPRLHHMQGYGKYKGPDPIAIVAGGPSLNRTLDELSTMQTIMVCGTAHDHLVSLGFLPDYAVLADPDPIMGGFIKKPVDGCNYLVSSGCDDSVFKALEGFQVTLWNSAGIDLKYFQGEPVVQGGCTVTLRALNIAIVLGHLNQHFFGFDSSFEDGAATHSYEHPEYEDVQQVRVGGEGGRVFLTNTTHICQALHFQEQLRKTACLFRPTVHGDGLIAEIMKQAEKDYINGLQLPDHLA